MSEFLSSVISDIIQNVKGWSTNPIALTAQLLAIVSSVLNCLGYIYRKREQFLITQIGANAVFGIQYYLLGGMAAVVNNIVNIFKLLLMYSYERKNKLVPPLLTVGLCVLSVALGIATFDGTVISLIPPFVAVLYTVSLAITTPLIFRFLLLLCSICWIIYDIYVAAYIAGIYTLIEFIVGIATFIREIVKPTVVVKKSK